ncbi:MAG: hypothetical protein U1F23_12040 [Lysobacterales bacterium]
MMHRIGVFLLAAAATAAITAAQAGVIDTAQRQLSQQTWSAWGGDAGFHWNTDLLGNLGMTPGSVTGAVTVQETEHHTWFPVRESGGLQFTVVSSALQAVTGGSLQLRGGMVLALRDGSTIDLRNATIRPRAGEDRALELVSADGHAWFRIDHLMFRLAGNGHQLQLETSDIRVTPELADRLGTPEAANWSVGILSLQTTVYVQGQGSPMDACDQNSPTYPWPGHDVPGEPGQTYQADLFMLTFDAQFMRCNGCDGPGGTDGKIVYAPDSSLENNVNNGTLQATIPNDPLGTSTALYAGNIAWNQMFSGSPPNWNQPYKNDQHPFLIWNMYRVDPDGSIVQIGRSGVKHAFLTVNWGCEGTCYDGNSLGRGCQDTYATGNNDYSDDLGPRSEIVPAQGIWGRCGSIWDPQCTGSEHSNGNGNYDDRLIVHESQIDPGANPGATYLFESWYLAREDINILNSMATLRVTPHWNSNSHSWSLQNQTNYRLGPAIDRWVDPSNPGSNAATTELTTSEGHAKVAVKVVDNGDGTWTYQYAVMNLDFARGVIQGQPGGTGPDPRVVSNHGFDQFSVPVPSGAVISAWSYDDGDNDSTDNWGTHNANGSLTWSRASARPRPVSTVQANRGRTLDWGSMARFEVTVNAPPVSGNVDLHVGTPGAPASLTAPNLLVPGT